MTTSSSASTPQQSSATFSDFSLHPLIVEALASKNIIHPFAIQELTLPLALGGHDLIGQARTGMGKTYGFGLPLLHRLFTQQNQQPLTGKPRALVIVPTRELCVQVEEDLAQAASLLRVPTGSSSSSTRRFRVAAIYGGTSMSGQISVLKKGVDLVVGTPGRLLDLAQQGHLRCDTVTELVLDEADVMLDLGFLPDMRKIISLLPEARHTMLFSATMPGPIITLANDFMVKPTHIRAESSESSATHDTTRQFVYRAHSLNKTELVSRILQARGRGRTMIFVRTKRTAQRAAEDLADRGFHVGTVHGDLDQKSRERALQAFRDNTLDVLVATDVAARGIDVDDVTHVINYQCPSDEKTYIHRIGRTGRAGNSGVAVTLVDWEDLDRWMSIDELLDLNMGEPRETYHTSDWIYSDLDIDPDVPGHVGPPTELIGRPKRERRGRNARGGRNGGRRGQNSGTRNGGQNSGGQRGRNGGKGSRNGNGGNGGRGKGASQQRHRRSSGEKRYIANSQRAREERRRQRSGSADSSSSSSSSQE